jgi:hypothetical protein
MSTVLWLFAAQSVLGAFDTLYYHEYKARLVAVPAAHRELMLHAARDFIYTILFATLPFVAWHGLLVLLLGFLITAEIGITIADFIEEDHARRALGGVYPGERASHTVMALIYGAVLASFFPVLVVWFQAPTGFSWEPPPVPDALRVLIVLGAGGVFVSGVRDVLAVKGVTSWPWKR